MREVVDRLASAPQVPGRMERIADTPCIVLRDYAHTPDALERALRDPAAAHPADGSSWCSAVVAIGTGASGPSWAASPRSSSDLAIATSDNPRTEDPDAIIDDIEQGMGGVPHLRIPDRLAAIRAALNEARAGDTILLAGKGHETYQVIGTEKDRLRRAGNRPEAVRGER